MCGAVTDGGEEIPGAGFAGGHFLFHLVLMIEELSEGGVNPGECKDRVVFLNGVSAPAVAHVLLRHLDDLLPRLVHPRGAAGVAVNVGEEIGGHGPENKGVGMESKKGLCRADGGAGGNGAGCINGPPSAGRRRG